MRNIISQTIQIVLAIIFLMNFSACKKDLKTTPTYTETTSYSSLQDFYNQNGVAKETFTFNSVVGGTFISAKGTTVSVPADAFKDVSNNLINDVLTFEFKDIYKKSDMVLSDMPTNWEDGGSLVSAGEFYINILCNTSPFKRVKTVSITQPSFGPIDPMMAPFVQITDSFQNPAWRYFSGSFPQAIVSNLGSSYIFSLYGNPYTTTNSGPNGGLWFNSDNPFAFDNYSKTTLTLNNSNNIFNPDVFLIFSGLNSVVHVFNLNGFVYSYAPVGLQCTVVAVDVKDGKLFSSFTPITISNNLSLTFTLQETNVTAFKSKLNSLN